MPRQPIARVCHTTIAILAAVVLIAPLSWADEVKTNFNVPAEDLSPALREFARQSNREILFSSDVAQGKTTNGVKGALGADTALIKLLAGTGLVVAKSANGTILVTTPDAKEASGQSGPPIAPNGAAKIQSQSNETTQGQKNSSLEEVIVTGSRIPLSAGQKPVQPVRSYTREDIARSGQSTMGEFLNTLPDVSSFTNSAFNLGLVGLQTVQLHGLPIGTTITLLDGRRVETNALGLFDLSNIPVSAVERVEILPIGASAVYGADSLAGAVNIILRKDFTGIEANATLDHANGVDDPGVNMTWGGRGERGSVSLIASYEAHDELLGAQREPTSLTSLPTGILPTTLAGDTCAPGNVYSFDGTSNLPGLSSPQAGIPSGVSGVPTLAQFVATAGKLNVCNSGRYTDITPRSQREGVLVSAHYGLAPSTDLFAELLLSHKQLRYQGGPQLTVYSSFLGTVAADNPYNPFGQPVNVSFVYPGTGGTEDNQSTSLIRPIIGVRGPMFSTWHYEATATLSRDRLHDVGEGADPSRVADALSSSDPATALNPFTSGAPATPELLQSFLNTVDTVYDDQIVSGQVILRGPVLRLPAGSMQAVIGGEYAREKQQTANNYSSAVGGSFYSSLTSLQRTTYAVSGEARIPLLAEGVSSTRQERLTLTIAGRSDHSSDYGSKATWQGALLWRVIDTLSLSGSYGTSYREPRLNEVSGSQVSFVGPLFLSDPYRGNQLATYDTTTIFGPNYSLKPESGKSTSLGLTYSRETRLGPRASVTWYDLKISNFIASPLAQVIVDHPDLFPGAVVRAPATPADQQQGFLGVITQLNETFYNYGDLRVSGFDADVSYAIDTRAGQFTPSLAIANVYKWQSALTPDSPAIDGVSKAILFGTGWAPRWKGTAALTWNQGPISAQVAGRYIGRYLDYQEFFPNTHETGNTWIIDVSARFEMSRALTDRAPWLAGGYISLGAVNLFNKAPPFALLASWYDYQEYDLRGRFLHLSVGTRF